MHGHPTARRRNVILLAAAVFLGVASPAHAAFQGVCTMEVTVYFDDDIGPEPALNGTFSFMSNAVDSDCQGRAIPSLAALSTKVNFDSTGTPSIVTTSCELTVATGLYTAIFDDDFSNSSGSFTFAGNVAGGTMTLQGLISPTFVGEVDLLLDPPQSAAGEIEDCIDGVQTSWVYSGTLRFVES